MMKYLIYASLLGLLLTGCRGSASEGDADQPATDLPTLEVNTDFLADEAGIPGSDRPVELLTYEGRRRYEYQRYIVVIKDMEAGERITVYERVPTDTVEQRVGQFGDEQAYFAGLRGHYLLLDSGINAGMRTLTLIDLQKGKRSFQANYLGSYAAFRGDQLVFFGLMPGDPVECTVSHPTQGQLPGRRFDAFWLTMATNEVQRSGQQECFYVE